MYKFRNYFLFSAILLVLWGSFLANEKQPSATMCFYGAFFNVIMYIIALNYNRKQKQI